MSAGLRRLRVAEAAFFRALPSPARQLCEPLGFRAHGTEPAAPRVDGRFHDESGMG